MKLYFFHFFEICLILLCHRNSLFVIYFHFIMILIINLRRNWTIFLTELSHLFIIFNMMCRLIVRYIRIINLLFLTRLLQRSLIRSRPFIIHLTEILLKFVIKILIICLLINPTNLMYLSNIEYNNNLKSL